MLLLTFLALLFSAESFGLVGGEKAAPDQFPAVALMEECTVAKVGDFHFLLAAHCVVKPGLDDEDLYANQTLPTFAAGSTVRLDRAVDHTKGKWSHTLHVAHTFVSPAYRYSSVTHPWLKPQGIADLAVVVVKEKTPEIPQLSFVSTPLKPGEAVVKLGYGCPETESEKIRDWVTAGDRELKFAASTVEPGTDALASYVAGVRKKASAVEFYSTSSRREFIAGSFLVTAGKYHAGPPKKASDTGDAKLASLGFSDSGGPVLAKRKGKWVVVGVNAKSLLWPAAEHGTKLEPVAYDLHTRLDEETVTAAADWLGQVLDSKAPEGLLAGVVEGKTGTTEVLLTHAYLRREVKKLTLALTSADGKPCPRPLEKAVVYDLNLEDSHTWASEPNEDEDEKPLKKQGPGRYVLTSATEMKVESLKLTFLSEKGAPACLFRLE